MSGECDKCGEHALDCECIDCTEFHSGSSKYSLKYDEFGHLDIKDKKKLISLMSRIMERAYRRGVQQTIVLYEKGAIDPRILANLYEYRYENSLRDSPGLDGYKGSSATRLQIEENLWEIGFESVDR